MMENKKWNLLKKGDKFIFGSYAPKHSNVHKFKNIPITWRVLEIEEDRMLVLSEYILDLKPFHTENIPVTWTECELNHWLNTEFLNTAFSKEEQAFIFKTENSSNVNEIIEIIREQYGIPLATYTNLIQEQIFLLSDTDIATYFEAKDIAYIGTEALCTENVLSMQEIEDYEMYIEGCWWLRTNMEDYVAAYIVSPCATIGVSGIQKDNPQGVRPAMWLKLNQ